MMVILPFPKFGDFSLFVLGFSGELSLFKSGTEDWVNNIHKGHGFGDIISYEGRF